MENKPSKEDILEKFKKAMDNEDHLRWRFFAEKLLRVTNGRETALRGEDVISEVIDRIITDDRNFRTDINLDQYVIMTIKSIVYADGKKNSKLVTDIPTGTDGQNEDLNSIIDTTNRKTYIEPNENLEQNEIFNIFWEACEDDEDAQLVLLEMKEGTFKTGELSKSLGITPEGVINIKKRIKRRVDRKQL